jgi:hypothetical protein
MDINYLNEEHVHIIIKNYDYPFRNVMTISWDTSNELIHNLMIYESNLFHEDDNRIRSCFWINTVKDLSNWDAGKIIYLNVRSWGDGEMKIDFSCESVHVYSSIIDEKGYFLVKKYIQDVGYDELYKFPCLYNEILDEKDDPYIFK